MEKIGVVGVDSGQLMIVDPCYIDNDWKKKSIMKKRMQKKTLVIMQYAKKTMMEFVRLTMKQGIKVLQYHFVVDLVMEFMKSMHYLKNLIRWI